MRIVFYYYDEGCDSSIKNHPEIEEMIEEITSECKEAMHVYILGGRYGTKGKRIPFCMKSKVYLGVCGELCALVIAEDYLNIRQDIYIIDHGVIPFKDTPFFTECNVNANCR